MLLKKVEFKLWQLFVYELSIICLGIVLGVYWFDFFAKMLPILFSIFAISGVYIIVVFWKQIKD